MHKTRECRTVGANAALSYDVGQPDSTGHSLRSTLLISESAQPRSVARESRGSLHRLANQHLDGLAVEQLPGRLSYGKSPLPQVGCSLLDLVAREHNQFERLRVPVSCLFWVVLDPHR